MAERPILFSGPLVRAILEDRKTQTRRVLAPRNTDAKQAFETLLYDQLSPAALVENAKRRLVNRYSPYGLAGDRLWVRETWKPADRWADNADRDPPRAIAYAADRSALWWDDRDAPPRKLDTACWNLDFGSWKPSIHMPRWASRIDLEVTDVRIERLQAITEEDARAEGVAPLEGLGADQRLAGRLASDTRSNGTHPHTIAFALLWDTINGKREGCSWSANPWVWVVSFRREEAPDHG